MAYETKALLIAIGDIIRSSRSTEEAFKRVAKVANAEGVLLDPFVEEGEDGETKTNIIKE